MSKSFENQKEMFEAILKAQSDADECFFIVDDDRIVFANDACERITGFSPVELMEMSSFFDIVSSDQRKELSQVFKARVSGEIDEARHEIIILKKGGEQVFIEVAINPIKINDKTQLLVIGRDITEFKQKEEELRKRARQMTSVADLGKLALTGGELSVVMDKAVSEVAENLEVEYCKILELLPGGKELLLRAGVGWKEGYVGSATVGAGTDSQAGYTLISSEPVIVEDLRTEKRFTGPPLLHEQNVVSGISVIIPGEHRPFGVMGAHTPEERLFAEDDVIFLKSIANVIGLAVERKESETQLEKSLEEKETLLREIHHRLKNSLHVISNLLDLQFEDITDEKVKKSIIETQARIESVARIHKHLYESEHIGEVNLPTYVENFVDDIRRVYGSRAKSVKLEIEVEDITLNIDKAIYCGLIINEILTNSFLHAFPSGEKGKIWIKAKSSEDEIVLTIGDNGVGLAEDFEFQKAETLGMQLIDVFADQLGASVEINNQNKTEFIIKFSK